MKNKMPKSFMKKQIKNRYLIYMIMFSVLLGTFFGTLTHNVSALSPNTWYICDFSGTTNGQQISTDWFNTYSLGYDQFSCDGAGTFKIQKTWDGGGANKPRGNFVFTYITDYNLSLWKLSFKMKITTGTGLTYFYFNDTVSGKTLFKLEVNDNPHWLIVYYNYSDSSWENMMSHNNSDIDLWHYVNATFYPSNETVMLSSDIENKNDVVNTVWLTNNNGLNDYSNIDSLDKIYIVNTQYGATINIDDVKIMFSDNGFAPPNYGCSDLTSYTKIGISNTFSYGYISGSNMFKIYNIPSTGKIKAITLGVNTDQYTYDSNLSHYTLNCVGYELGNPSCFYREGINYILEWDTTIELGSIVDNIVSGQLIYFTFRHSQTLAPLYSNTYWKPCIGESITTDLDSDGHIGFKYGTPPGGNPDWIPQTQYNFDLGVSVYLENAYPNDVYNYIDSLGLHNWYDKNTTGYKFKLDTPEGILCSYLLGNPSLTYKIEVYKNNSLDITYNNLNYPGGVIGYSPSSIGKYTFKLYSSHYVYNITAYVDGTIPDYYISTNPPITNPFMSYTIRYKFNHPQGKTGTIGIFKNSEDSSILSNAYSTFSITNNITSSINYPSTSITTEYLGLFVNISYNPRVAFCKHFIRDINVGRNYIVVSTPIMEINKNNPENKSVTIIGTHMFLGCDVSIHINGIFFANVGNSQQINIDYVPTQAKNYKVSLMLRQNNTMIYLDNCTFSVTEIPVTQTPPTIDILPAPFSYICGGIVTIMFIVAPVILVGKLNIQSDIIKYVPVFSGVLGFIVCCLIGLFPWYSIFALIVVLVILLMVFYQSRKIAS